MSSKEKKDTCARFEEDGLAACKPCEDNKKECVALSPNKTMRRVRVTNDGTPMGTKLIDVNTGEEMCLDSVAKITWVNDVNAAPRVVVEFITPKVEVEGGLFYLDADSLGNEYRGLKPVLRFKKAEEASEK